MSIDYERRAIHVAPHAASAASRSLWGMGVSVYTHGDGTLTALMRLGNKGIQDRVSLYQVEVHYSLNLQEQIQWLNMCWILPAMEEVTA
jgi:hypothetical protein